MTSPRDTKSKLKLALDNLPPVQLRFIEPMLAKLSNALPAGDSWWYEIKYDGFRAVAVKHKREVTMYSRRGNRLNQRFPGLPDALNFLPANTIVDGEIVALDSAGRPSFATLQNSLNRG